MIVYIATLEDPDSTRILGAYSSEQLASERITDKMEELYELNQDASVNPVIVEVDLDDVDPESYT